MNIPKEHRGDNGCKVFELYSHEADASARAVSIKAETNTGIPNLNRILPDWRHPWNNEEQISEEVDFFKVADDSLLHGQDPLDITWNVGLVQYRSRFETKYTFKKIPKESKKFTGIKSKDGRIYRFGHFTEDFEWSQSQLTNVSYYFLSKFMRIRIIMKETDNLFTVEHDSTVSLINFFSELGGTLKYFDVLSKLLLVVAFIIWMVKILKCDRAYSKLKKIERMIAPVDDSVEEREHTSNTVVIDDHSRPSAILMEPLLDNQDAS